MRLAPRLLPAVAALALAAHPADARRRVTAKPADRSVMALKDPARLVALGQAMEARGSVGNAFSFYDRALEIDPRYAAALRAGGDLALRRGDGPLAFGYFAAWASQEPKAADAFLGMASALNLRQQPGEALPVLDRALALGAGNGGVAAQRGLALDLLGRQRDAQVAYAQALQASPDDRATTQRMALSLAISGDRAAAVQLLRRYAADPNATEITRTLALVDALTGDLRGAVEIANASFLPAEARTLIALYARLPSLSDADQAVAALLGRVPAAAVAAMDAPPDPEPAAPPAVAMPQRDPDALTPEAARAAPRFWVQLAATADRAALTGEWHRIQRDAGALTDGLSVFVERTAKTNRLLAGPFADLAGARALIAGLAAKRIDAVVNRTAAGARLEALGLPK